MILTYMVEYDKIHYPLPLLYQDQPSVEMLKSTISRLRGEITKFRSDPALVKSYARSQEGMFNNSELG
jgi:coiled-coil domain-containing protein 61